MSKFHIIDSKSDINETMQKFIDKLRMNNVKVVPESPTLKLDLDNKYNNYMYGGKIGNKEDFDILVKDSRQIKLSFYLCDNEEYYCYNC